MDYHHSDPFFSDWYHTYKLEKFLVPIFFDITQNEFTAQDSFTFANEILTQDSDSIYGSLDVDSYLPTLIRLKYLQKETFAEFG